MQKVIQIGGLDRRRRVVARGGEQRLRRERSRSAPDKDVQGCVRLTGEEEAIDGLLKPVDQIGYACLLAAGRPMVCVWTTNRATDFDGDDIPV